MVYKFIDYLSYEYTSRDTANDKEVDWEEYFKGGGFKYICLYRSDDSGYFATIYQLRISHKKYSIYKMTKYTSTKQLPYRHMHITSLISMLNANNADVFISNVNVNEKYTYTRDNDIIKLKEKGKAKGLNVPAQKYSLKKYSIPVKDICNSVSIRDPIHYILGYYRYKLSKN